MGYAVVDVVDDAVAVLVIGKYRDGCPNKR